MLGNIEECHKIKGNTMKYKISNFCFCQMTDMLPHSTTYPLLTISSSRYRWASHSDLETSEFGIWQIEAEIESYS